MPIYEYACRACEHRFETIQRASEDPLTDCPTCGESTLKKLLSAPVFRLKGSGWYETDFKKGSKRNLSEGEGGGGSQDGGKSDTDSKSGSSAESGSSSESSGSSESSESSESKKTSDTKSTGGAKTSDSTPATSA